MIFPNPASHNFSIVSQLGTEVLSVEIFNIDGTELMRQEITNNDASFNLSLFPQGLYVIRIHTDKGIAVKKLIIQ